MRGCAFQQLVLVAELFGDAFKELLLEGRFSFFDSSVVFCGSSAIGMV